MGFALRYIDGDFVPELVCDACKRSIEDPQQGVAYCAAPSAEGDSTVMFFCRQNESEESTIGVVVSIEEYLTRLLRRKGWEGIGVE